MKVFKFVTDNFNSPGPYATIHYPLGGKVELNKNDYDKKSAGQCARGIHVIPFVERIDWDNVVVSSQIIIGEINKKDIIYSNDDMTGKMRVKKMSKIRQATQEEIEFIRNTLNTAIHAYKWSKYIDKYGTDFTRDLVCSTSDVELPYLYALYVDGPHEMTRNICAKNSYWALLYAKYVDHGSHEITRLSASQDPEEAFEYARLIDKEPHPDTRAGVANDMFYRSKYNRIFGKTKEDWENLKPHFSPYI